MQVEIPVVYELHCRLKRHRNESICTVYAYESVRIAESQAGDMPVAARRLGLPESHVRWDGEHFWAPDLAGADASAPAAESAGMTLEEWSGAAGGLTRIPASLLHFYRADGRPNPRYASPFDPDEHRDPTSSTFEKERAALLAWISERVRLIDGTVYRRCSQPVFSLSAGAGKAGTSLGTGQPRNFATWYALTRREDAADAMRNAGHDASGLPDPEILLPQAFNVRDEALSLRCVCMCFLAGTHYLGWLSDEAGIEWYRLRSAFRDFDGGMDEEAGERLIRQADRFLEVLGEPDWHFRDGAKHLRRAADRWKERPMEVELGFAP